MYHTPESSCDFLTQFLSLCVNNRHFPMTSNYHFLDSFPFIFTIMMFSCICNVIMPLQVIPCHMHNECYMDNSTHSYCQCIMENYIYMHTISIHHFTYVNISYKHILAFTFNMSFYDQAMTHQQASHVMSIAHNNSSHINMLELSH